jgi:DNA adenine methylase
MGRVSCRRHRTGVRPLLRWAGSKRRAASVLADYWQRARATRYVEPFAGSAALFYYVGARRALLGDLNEELIHTYRTIKREPRLVGRVLRSWPGNAETYYRLRALVPSTMTPSQRAARFLYLNRWCFNGIYRTNKKGQFNVPFGGVRVGPPVVDSELIQTALMLQRARLICGDFEDTLALVESSDFVFMDPPYSVSGKRVFNDYSAQGFGETDLCRLRLQLERIDSLGARFLVSYADSQEGEWLARGFEVATISVHRNVGGFRSRRRRALEILISNVGAA